MSGDQPEPLHSDDGLFAQSQTSGRLADHVAVTDPNRIRPRAIKNYLALRSRLNFGVRRKGCGTADAS